MVCNRSVGRDNGVWALRVGPSKAGQGRADQINAGRTTHREDTRAVQRRCDVDTGAGAKTQIRHRVDMKQGLQDIIPGQQQ